MMMNDAVPMDENAFGGLGEFVDTPEYTEAEWAAHDAQVAAEYDAWQAEAMMDFYDYEPNPYDGTYSEM